jgi:hypothetical protein
MTYEKTHFNDTVVLSMTKKQFLFRGGIGNKLSTDQLSEVYDLIQKLHANDSKLTKGSAKAGPEKREPASDGRY